MTERSAGRSCKVSSALGIGTGRKSGKWSGRTGVPGPSETAWCIHSDSPRQVRGQCHRLPAERVVPFRETRKGSQAASDVESGSENRKGSRATQPIAKPSHARKVRTVERRTTARTQSVGKRPDRCYCEPVWWKKPRSCGRWTKRKTAEIARESQPGGEKGIQPSRNESVRTWKAPVQTAMTTERAIKSETSGGQPETGSSD